MKKILAILMAMMMIVTECVCVFAEECNLDEQVIVESTVETATVTAENPEIMEESKTVTEPAEEEDAEIVTDETVIVNDDNGQETAEESDCGSIDEPVNSEPVQEVIPETVAQPEAEIAETENAEVVNAPVEVANEDTDSDPEERIPAEVTVTKEEKVAAEVTAIEETASEPIAEVENVQSEKDNVTEVAAPEIIETSNEETPADEEPAEEEKVIGMAVILEETPLYTSPEGEEIKDVILLEGELCAVYEYDEVWSRVSYHEYKGYVETRLLVPYVREEKKEEVPAEVTVEITEPETIEIKDEGTDVSEAINTVEDITVVEEVADNETVENEIENNNEVFADEEIVTAVEEEITVEMTDNESVENDPETLETGDSTEEIATEENETEENETDMIENVSEVTLSAEDNDSPEVLIVEESADEPDTTIETEVGSEVTAVIIEESAETEATEVVIEEATSEEIPEDEIPAEEIKGQTIRKTKLYSEDGEVLLIMESGRSIEILETNEKQTRVRYNEYTGLISNDDIAVIGAKADENLRSIILTTNTEGMDVVYVGMTIEIHAELKGFEELEYDVQWQMSPDGGTTVIDIPGANQLTYSYTLNRDNYGFSYRVYINVKDPV